MRDRSQDELNVVPKEWLARKIFHKKAFPQPASAVERPFSSRMSFCKPR